MQDRMGTNVGMEPDIIEQLLRLQEMDRARDRLRKRIDAIPVKLKGHTDAIAALDAQLQEQGLEQRTARAEADRAELEVKTREADREKTKKQMNAPKLSNREYQTLQEQLAGVLADINSQSDIALKALDRAEQAEARAQELSAELDQAREAYEKARSELEGSLAGVRDTLAERDKERAEVAASVTGEAFDIYERVRRKHPEAMAMVEGTIDRAAGRIGTDLHCSACYMSVTANDAVHVLGRRRLVQCKSCVRILYVP